MMFKTGSQTKSFVDECDQLIDAAISEQFNSFESLVNLNESDLGMIKKLYYMWNDLKDLAVKQARQADEQSEMLETLQKEMLELNNKLLER